MRKDRHVSCRFRFRFRMAIFFFVSLVQMQPYRMQAIQSPKGPSGELWMHFTSCVTHRQLTRGQLWGRTQRAIKFALEALLVLVSSQFFVCLALCFWLVFARASGSFTRST